MGQEGFNFAAEVGWSAIERCGTVIAGGVIEGFDLLPAGRGHRQLSPHHFTATVRFLHMTTPNELMDATHVAKTAAASG